MRLDEALAEIHEAAETLLGNATAEDELLEGVNTIQLGEERDSTPPFPLVAIVLDAANCVDEATTHIIREVWTVPVNVVALYYTVLGPDTGYREATKIAARARSVLLADRNLGKPGVVHDARSLQFTSSDWRYRDGLVYAAVATIQVRFRVTEGR